MTDAARVLVSGVVLSQPMGGVRRHNAELLPRVAARLRAAGGALGVLAPREGLALELPDEVEVLPSNVPSGPPVPRALSESRALQRELDDARRRGAPWHVVHSAHLPAPRVDVPQTITVHDLRAVELTSGVRRALAARVVGDALARAQAVVTVSATVADAIAQRFGTPRDKLYVVANAADHLATLPRDPAPDAPLLAVGHVEPRKNLELLVEALAADPTLPALHVAGAPKGDEAERLVALARERGVSGRVRFLGPVDDAELPRLYASAACVVLPSRLEGFGIGALEAMRARVPLCISTAPALREITGELVPAFEPDDPAGCARAVREALAASSDDLDRAARRAAEFAWEASADAWTDVFLRVGAA